VHVQRSLPEQRIRDMKLKDQFVFQLRFSELQLVRVLVVKVQRPGTDSKCVSTRESLIFTAHPALLRKSLTSESILVSMSTLSSGNNETSSDDFNWLLKKYTHINIKYYLIFIKIKMKNTPFTNPAMINRPPMGNKGPSG
jgi:hypothetical protein